MQQQKWEYLHLVVGENDGKSAIVQVCQGERKTLSPSQEDGSPGYVPNLVNTLGEIGWELVSVLSVEDEGILSVFKRPKVGSFGAPG